MAKFRSARERNATLEKENAERVAELVAEKEAAERRELELLEALESARRTADMSLGKAQEMATRVEKMESTHEKMEGEMVSRDTVNEMEALFNQT